MLDCSRSRLAATRRPVRLLVALMLAGTAASGCGNSVTEPAAFTLNTQRTQYAAGDAATVTVTNKSGRDVELGVCEPYALDARAGDAWREVYRSPTGGYCVAVAIELPNNGTVPVTVALPKTLPASAYRVRIARFEPAATNTFDVR